MRKFTTIFMAVVLCIAALTVFAFAATDCSKGDHDWSAWNLVKIENGTKYYERTCACGTVEPQTKSEHTHKLVAVEAVAPTCEEFGNIAYSYCEYCDWMQAEGGVATNAQAVKLAPTHKLVAVEAKEATCEEFGNIAYWYCENCDWVEVEGGVASNRQAVKLAPAHSLVAVEAKASTCFELGNIAYWYCSNCDWVEVEGGVASNLKAVKLPLAHVVEHVEAKAATATENGNIEYWYCKDCGYAWLDAACTKNTNLKAVILPATGETPAEPGSPDTGDNAIFFAVVLVAVAVAGVAVVSFKKREN